MSAQDFELQIDLYRDWIETLRNSLESLGYEIDDDAEPFDICRQYFNVDRRSITQKPRRVLVSNEFEEPEDSEIQTAIEAIKRKASRGEDLNPHLSRNTWEEADYNDRLLNDWGIHHLHLSTASDKRDPRLVKRTGQLLFARVTTDAFYMICIMGHKDKNDNPNWAKTKLIEILHTNWPESLTQYKAQGIQGGGFSDEQIYQLRQSGAQTLVEVSDGTVYMGPGGGLVSTGGSAQVTMQCDWWKAVIEEIERIVRDNLDYLVEQARTQSGIEMGPKLRFYLESISDDGIAIVELNSGARFVEQLPQDT